MWSEHDLKSQYDTADIIQPDLPPEPHLTAKEASVEIGEEAVLLGGPECNKGARPVTQKVFLTGWSGKVIGESALKVFIKLPDCEVPLRAFRKDDVLPRLLKHGLLPPSIKLIECCPDSEDLGERVKQTNKEIELEAGENGEEDEEPSDTPHDEDGELSQDSEDAASSAEETKCYQKKEEVVKEKKLKKKPTQGKETASKREQGNKSKRSKKKPAKHVFSEHDIRELAWKVEEAGVAALNNAGSACIREVSKLFGLYVPEK